MDLNHILNTIASGLLGVFLFYFLVRFDAVDGRLSISRKEYLEVEKQLKVLTKPAIKTIKTDQGDIYDCVDFYKQPAFDHPSLKNHSYHFLMKPQFSVENVDEFSTEETVHFGLKDGGCPLGTVPIKRTTKEDLIREKIALKFTDYGGTHILITEKTKDLPRVMSPVGVIPALGHKSLTTAAIRTKEGKYAGALGFVSVYNPEVHDRQYSAARITLQNDAEFLQIGWRVDPTLYGDASTHFYIQTNLISGRCFDAKCGFVVTSRDIPPSYAYPQNVISVVGGKIYDAKMRVQLDEEGNWWLSTTKNNHQVGFWPSKLFNGLQNFAKFIDWGGEVGTPHNVPAPPMGSGLSPANGGDSTSNAYFRWVTGINPSGFDFNPETEPYDTDNLDVYGVLDFNTSSPAWEHIAYFGGSLLEYSRA